MSSFDLNLSIHFSPSFITIDQLFCVIRGAIDLRGTYHSVGLLPRSFRLRTNQYNVIFRSLKLTRTSISWGKNNTGSLLASVTMISSTRGIMAHNFVLSVVAGTFSTTVRDIYILCRVNSCSSSTWSRVSVQGEEKGSLLGCAL